MNLLSEKIGVIDKPARVVGKTRFLVIGALLLIWLSISLQRVNVSILLVDPRFLADMDLVGQNAKQGLVMTLFLLPYALTNVLASPLSDRIGPRKTALLGLMIAILAVTVAGFAQGLVMLLGARILMGIGHGIHFPSNSCIIKNWFPPVERGRANSIYSLGGSLGPLVAMPLFSFVIWASGWEATFFFVAGMALLMSLPLWFGLVTDSPADNKHVGPAEKNFIARNMGHSHHAEPDGLLHHGWLKLILHSREFWLVTVCYSAYLSIWWGLITWIPQYLMVARGFPWQSLGWMASIPYVFAAVGIILGGFLSDRLMKREVFTTISLIGSTVCLLIAAYIPSNGWCVIFISLAAGFNTFIFAPIWVLLQALMPLRLIGLGSGVMNGISNFVSALAPVIIGGLIQLTSSYAMGLIYLVVLGGAGGIASLYLVRRQL
ncbi:MAG: MFS transporter [Firmicutes bacterium]|nr:MFS transporter [Bacillota bacterium]